MLWWFLISEIFWDKTVIFLPFNWLCFFQSKLQMDDYKDMEILIPRPILSEVHALTGHKVETFQWLIFQYGDQLWIPHKLFIDCSSIFISIHGFDNPAVSFNGLHLTFQEKYYLRYNWWPKNSMRSIGQSDSIIPGNHILPR